MGAERKSIVEESNMTPFLKRITVFSGGGPFLDGYILTMIGIALIQVSPQLGLDDFWTGLVGASALIGLFAGGLIFGYVTDIVGRTLMYKIDLIAMIVCSILQMFVVEAWQLVALRFLMGIAVGADYPIATSLLAEFAPKKQRGLLLGLMTSLWYVGALAAGLVGYVLLQTGPEGWKWMLGSAAIPAFILVIGRWGAPESPRWLLSKGRKEEALAVVKRIWGPEAELTDLEQEDDAVVKTDVRELFKPGYLKRLIFVCVFWTCQVTPLFAIYTFGPTLLGAFGFEDGNLWVIGYVVIDLMFLLGSLPPLWLLNIVGRRPLLIFGFAFMTLGLLVLGIFPGAAVGLIITCFCVYAFFSGAPAELPWIYSNELFPTEIRATAVGIGTAVSRIGSAIGTFVLPWALATFGIGATMLAGAIISFVGLAVSIFMAPETKGMTLREASSVSTEETNGIR